MIIMKKLFTPAFIAVFSIFTAQVAFKVATIIRSDTLVLTSEFIKLPISSMLAISAADTIGVASSMAVFVSFATFFFNYVSNIEAKSKEANKS